MSMRIFACARTQTHMYERALPLTCCTTAPCMRAWFESREDCRGVVSHTCSSTSPALTSPCSSAAPPALICNNNNRYLIVRQTVTKSISSSLRVTLDQNCLNQQKQEAVSCCQTSRHQEQFLFSAVDFSQLSGISRSSKRYLHGRTSLHRSYLSYHIVCIQEFWKRSSLHPDFEACCT